MSRGRFRVLLGAAPGVGKTYAMLEEGIRLRNSGQDVVVGFIETHDRARTAAMIGDLEMIPRLMIEHRGARIFELDVDAVLARRPQIALVDELAHSNATGSRHEKRWQDVETLLDAGIAVISTMNIQHIESLSDVVTQITGIAQTETIPDRVLRAADQLEIVDLAPENLRDRLAEGLVYPAARIDAALSNYFRLGNLVALRELALLWLADEVDVSLLRHGSDLGIDTTWEARERIVVALKGGPEGETLLRRGARIAARSGGGELLAVHVTSEDGLRSASPAALSSQQALAERLGGTFHQVVGDDIGAALVDFVRASNATQLVLGVSRRGRLAALLAGEGVGGSVIRESGDIDVHIVSHERSTTQRRLPRVSGGLTVRRRAYGFAFAVVVGPLLTWLLAAFRTPDSITAEVLAYQLLVVVVAVIGGIWPALFTAVLASVTLDYLFVAPLYTIRISEPLHVLALVLFLAIAALVSLVVDSAARRTRAAIRSAAESEMLARIASGVIRGDDALQALVSTTREGFGQECVRLVADGIVIAADGVSTNSETRTVLPVGYRAELELIGKDLHAADRRLLGAIMSQLDAALERRELTATARAADSLAETDRVRSALLAAVGHDLRRPLAAATAALTSLRSTDVDWSDEDRRDLMETAEIGLKTLADLVTDLLDVSRVQAGALAVSLDYVDLEDLLPPVLDELGLAPGDVTLELSAGLPAVWADAVLLQRVIVNLLSNAIRYSPPGSSPRLSASQFADSVELRIADTGPGVPDDLQEQIFVPFQRRGDTEDHAGIGLGLALSRGFVEGMNGTLRPEETPGGGLTMVVTLRTAESPRSEGSS